MIRIILVAACAAAGLAVASPAWASAENGGCAASPHRMRLVCSSDACLRLETQMLCDATARRQPARARAIRPISSEERSSRALDRLIASLD